MTLTITHGGDDISDLVWLENGIISLTNVADGGTAESAIQVDDEDGSIDLLSLQEVIVEESACSDPRCFTGIDLNNKIARGTYRSGPSRVWEMSIFDLNELLKRRRLRGSTANRPAETGSQRIAWLLTTTGMAGVIFDNGAIAANSWTYEATDYRGATALDVMESIVSASGELGRVFFVYWDQSANQPSLFYASPNAVLNTSTLRISNVLSDVDDTTTFAPYEGSDLEAQGEAIFDGVYVNYTGGTFYKQRAATYAEFGVHVDGEFTWDRITNATYAETHADTFLNRHSGKIDTINVTVRLPRDKVNFIDAGMRISVKFEHLPGFTSFTWTRVTRRTIVLTQGTNLYYDLVLELSVRGLDQAGGGSPGSFPAPPPTPMGHWYSGVMTFTNAFGGGGGWGVASMQTSVGGETTLTSTDTDGAVFQPSTLYNVEITAVGTNPADLAAISVALDPFPAAYPPNGGSPINFHVGDVNTSLSFSGSFTTGAGLAVNAPLQITSKAQGIGGPPQTVTVTWWIDPDGWDPGDAVPPLKGQRFGPITPVETPDGATYTFTLPVGYEFADNSLAVWVDRLDQTLAVTSYDGIARTFTLDFAPWGTDVIEVYGQHR